DAGDGSYVDLYDLCRRVAECDRLPGSVRSAAAGVMKSVEGFLIASFGMSGYKGFEAGKNGVFIVLPSGRPNCWKHFRWYTPARGDREIYGNWSFLKDGATPGNGAVENWVELLESWFDVPDDKGAVKAAPGTKKGVVKAAPGTNEELDRLQGEWTMVSAEKRGEKVRDEAVSRSKLTIKGDQWTVTPPEGKGRSTTMTMIIDPS